MTDHYVRDLELRLRKLELSTRGALEFRQAATTSTVDDTETTGSGGTSGGCCCQEGDCLKPIEGIGAVPARLLWIPLTAIPCDCEVPEGMGRIELFRVDPESDDVWESKHTLEEGETDADIIRCRYGCTATSYWVWPEDAVPTETPGEPWELVRTVNGSCGTPEKPDYDGEEAGDTAETEYVPPLEPAWWRANKAALVGGCDPSTLDFYIGDDEEEE